MKCLHPVRIRKPASVLEREREDPDKWVYDPIKGCSTLIPTMEVPCGKCVACLARRRNEWTFRLWHEANHSSSSLFVTLTYDDEHLPMDGNLQVSDYQKFLKRFRKNENIKFKYFLCGEYGSETYRPHYHMIIFNLPNRKNFVWHWERRIHDAWRNGNVMCDVITAARLNYVTKYMLKSEEFRTMKENGWQPPFIKVSHGLGEGLVKRLNYKQLYEGNFYLREMGEGATMPRYVFNKIPDYEREQLAEIRRTKAAMAEKELDDTYDYDKYVYELLHKRRTERIKH